MADSRTIASLASPPARWLPLWALLAAACSMERPPATDDQQSAPAKGAPAADTSADPMDSLLAVPFDTLTGLEAPPRPDTVPGPPGAPPGATPLAVPTVTVAPPPPVAPIGRRAASPGDTSAIVATAAELAELRARMGVPVAGIPAASLRDSYDEGRGARKHEGMDIAAPTGTPVIAAADGRVLRLHESKAGGHMVYAADASDRFIFMYAHLDRYAPGIAPGTPLRRGQLVGYVGTTGNAPPGTPHLHFAVARGRPSVKWWKGTSVNPYPLLKP
jgi:peptidoglycan LD-endopeptidase LytH